MIKTEVKTKIHISKNKPTLNKKRNTKIRIYKINTIM
jgi:hypothetical protein